ncbi:MAG: Ig-like domain-containing protein [Leptospirales bacterium]
MNNGPELLITSPVDLEKINKIVVDVTVSLVDTTVGGGKTDGFKYIKLFLDNKIVSEYLHEAKTPFKTHKFSQIDLSTFANSGFPVKIEAKAYTGNSLSSNNIVSNPSNIIIDTISPRITDLKPSEGSYINNLKEPISALVADDGGSHIDRNSIQLVVDDLPIDATKIKKTILSNDSIKILFEPEVNLTEAEHSYKIQAKDMAGNLVNSPKTKFLVDATPPEFQSVEPPNGAQLNTQSPLFTATVLKNGGSPLDLESIRIIQDGKSFSKENNPSLIKTPSPSAGVLTITFQPVKLPEGSHSIIFKLKDKAGNVAKSTEVLFTVDVSPPQIHSIFPGMDSIHNIASPKISAVITDGGGSHLEQSSVKVLLDGKPMDPTLKQVNQAGEVSDVFNVELQTANLPDGLHTLSVTARDLAGNETATEKTEFLVDTTPPVISSVFPKGVLDKQRLAEPVTVEVSDLHSGIDTSSCSATLIAANKSTYNLVVQENESIAPGGKVKLQFGPLPHIGLLGIGNHKLSLKLEDIAGNHVENIYDFEIKHAIPFENDSFQVFRSFTDFKNETTEEPYLLPPDFTYGEDFLLEIPDIVAGDATWKSEAENMVASVKKGVNKLRISIPGELIWSTDSDNRALLKSAFEKLLTGIELKESTLLQSGSGDLVRNRVVRSIPLAVSEILPWSCGLDRSLRAIPLMPGFRVRVSAASFQFCGPGRDQTNGMVPSGEMLLPVSRQRIHDGSFITTLNPMATGLSEFGYTTADESTDGMIGGLTDLHAGDLRRKYLAIVLPASLPSSATASSVKEEHVTLVAADTYSALSQGIQAAAGDFGEASADFILRRFRGRTGVVVELPLVLNGKKSYVPVGATLRQICEQHLHWFTPDLVHSGQVTWQRQWSDVSVDTNAEKSSIKLRKKQWSDIGLQPQNSTIDFADAPLLAGDHIEFRLD